MVVASTMLLLLLSPGLLVSPHAQVEVHLGRHLEAVSEGDLLQVEVEDVEEEVALPVPLVLVALVGQDVALVRLLGTVVQVVVLGDELLALGGQCSQLPPHALVAVRQLVSL